MKISRLLLYYFIFLNELVANAQHSNTLHTINLNSLDSQQLKNDTNKEIKKTDDNTVSIWVFGKVDKGALLQALATVAIGIFTILVMIRLSGKSIDTKLWDHYRELFDKVGKQEAEIGLLRTELNKKESELEMLKSQSLSTNQSRIDELMSEIERLKRNIEEKVYEQLKTEKDLNKAKRPLPRMGIKSKLLAKALQAESEKRYDDAIDFYKQASKRSFADASLAFYNIGKVQELKKNITEVEFNLLMAARIEPDNMLYVDSAINSLYKTENFEEILIFQKKKISLYKEQKAENTIDYVKSLLSIHRVFVRMDNLDEVKKLEKEIEEIILKNEWVETEIQVNFLVHKALLLQQMGETKAAMQLCTTAKAILLKLDDVHFRTPLNLYWQLGSINNALKSHKEALEFYDLALNITEREVGIESFEGSQLYINMGNAFLDSKNFEMAEKYVLESLRILTKIYGNSHRILSSAYNMMGSVLIEKGIDNVSCEYYKNALLVNPKPAKYYFMHTSVSYESLGFIYLNALNYLKAKESFELAYSASMLCNGSDHPITVQAMAGIGYSYLEMKQYIEASGFLKAAHSKMLSYPEYFKTEVVQCKEMLELAQKNIT